jgi:formate C-acetyltransferase
MGEDGRTLVTVDHVPHAAHPLQPRTRAGAQPHRVLVPRLPDGFKRFAIKTSIDTGAISTSRRPDAAQVGRHCAIACVSAMRVSKQMQFFGARVNLPKTLLYALNSGRDELSGSKSGQSFADHRGRAHTTR